MLVLVTGNPGAGKTLRTIQMVEELRAATGRPVFHAGVTGLKLPWMELADPLKWYESPVGAIIVMDECWKYFPARGNNQAVPTWVEQFAVHRKQGFDIFLITQHRHQVDTFVRKMVNRHIHIERKFGANGSTIWQWEKESDPSSNKEKESAVKTNWSFPKELYDKYHSAEIHTVRKDFPWMRLWWLPPVIVSIPVLGWFGINRMRHAGDGLVAASAKSAPGRVDGSGPGDESAAGFWSPKSNRPRSQAFPQSAPRWDGRAKVVSVEQLGGCAEMSMGYSFSCTCTDQAGAVVPMTVSACHALVRAGWFDPSRTYEDAKRANIAFLNAHEGSVAGVVAGGRAGTGGGSAQTPASGASPGEEPGPLPEAAP